LALKPVVLKSKAYKQLKLFITSITKSNNVPLILLQAVAVHQDHAAPTPSQAPPLTAATSVLAAIAALGVAAATLATPLTAGRSLQGCRPLLVHSPRVQWWSRVTLLSRVLW